MPGCDEISHRGTHDSFQREFEHVGTALVAVVDQPVGSECQRPFTHLFDQCPVRVLNALQREDLLSSWRLHHESIDRPLADGAKRFLQLFQLGP